MAMHVYNTRRKHAIHTIGILSININYLVLNLYNHNKLQIT